MKAIIHTQYGPPEVAQLKEVPKPTPQKNEILLKVHASTVNRTDCGFRSAEYFISRFWSGLLRPKHNILGSEFSGVVEKIGHDVTLFKEGDKVFGYNDQSFGGHAEYLVISENNTITTMPQHLPFDMAAAICEGAHYALVDIRAAKVERGHRVLVYGASGAIGSAAVQLLKYFGAKVTAVCGTKNMALVKSLGADTVIDYQTQDFTQADDKFDFIFDAVGKSSFRECKPLLTKKGIYISTELGKNGENIPLAIVTPWFKHKKVLFPIPSFSKEDLLFLKQLVEEGKYRPVIDRHYPLEQIVEAYRYVESGQKTGNVIIQIAS
jgi:NADPH:quinone reductase-like Zn-dependent oxidoreductase